MLSAYSLSLMKWDEHLLKKTVSMVREKLEQGAVEAGALEVIDMLIPQMLQAGVVKQFNHHWVAP